MDVGDRLTRVHAARNIGGGALNVFLDGTDTTGGSATDTIGSLANANDITIGARTGGAYWSGEIIAVALFREALTDAEILQVSTYLDDGALPSGFFDDVDALGALRDRLAWEGYVDADIPRELVGALNLFLGTTAGDVEGALNEKIGSGYVGIVQACNTLLDGLATVYEVNDGLRKLAELYVP